MWDKQQNNILLTHPHRHINFIFMNILLQTIFIIRYLWWAYWICTIKRERIYLESSKAEEESKEIIKNLNIEGGEYRILVEDKQKVLL